MYGRFGLKKVPRDPFRPSLGTFLFIHSRRMVKWVIMGEKCQMPQNGLMRYGSVLGPFGTKTTSAVKLRKGV